MISKALLAILLACGGSSGSAGEVIVLVPLGEVPQAVLEPLRPALESIFRQPVRWGQPLGLPNQAYSRARGQYQASILLNYLAKVRGARDERWLAVTEADLSVPQLNFVFGVGDPERRVAMISLARLREGLQGAKADEATFCERALKEAVHELGHTYGMRHCQDSTCVMHFSNSLADTDRKSHKFCPRHQQALER